MAETQSAIQQAKASAPSVTAVFNRLANTAQTLAEKPRVAESFDRTQTLHVRAGFVCQNDCAFCCDDGAGVHSRSLEGQAVRKMLEQNVGLACVEFTAHEPTLNPNLPQWVAWAKELGYPIVSVVTNGRMLGRGTLLQTLLDAGLNRVQISLHAHVAELHDHIVRRKNAFEQQRDGILAVVAARRTRPGLVLHIQTTVTQHNFEALPQIIPFMLAFGPDVYGLNCVFLTASAAKNIDETAVRYSEIVKVLQRCLPPTKREPIFVSEIPLCQIAGKLPVDYFGLREGFHLIKEDNAGDALETAARALHRGFEFGPKCNTCVLQRTCDGVPPAYVGRFGWEEFQPVTAERLAEVRKDTSHALQEMLSAPAGEWEIAGLESRPGYTSVRLRSPLLRRELTLQIRKRDDDYPAFARTAALNITLAGKYHAGEEIKLARKIVDVIQRREQAATA